MFQTSTTDGRFVSSANSEQLLLSQFFAAVVESSTDAIMTKTLDGKVTSWNAAAERMFGYSAAEMIGCPMTTIFPLHRRDEEQMILASIAAGQQVDHFETERLRRDGSVVHVSVTISPILNASGNVIGASNVARDISERKHVEAEVISHNEELERRVAVRTAEIEATKARLQIALEAAEAANQAKSAFLANMSHEIRTPMNAVIGMTYLMLRDVTDDLTAGRLRMVDTAARHLMEVISDVLDLSKIGAAKMTLENIDFSLDDDVVSRAVDLVVQGAHGKGIELIVDTGHVSPFLRGDPTRLAQMLVNLLSNAVKFTGKGWIRLDAHNMGVDQAGRNHIRFSVTDTGVGIPLNQQKSLFNAFQQADSTITRRHGGTGLGLSLVRHLATLMGGEAGVTSNVGAGSSFWFTVRLDNASKPRPPPYFKDLRQKRALLIDDVPEALTVVADRLRIFGMAVDCASSGPEALLKIRQQLGGVAGYDVLLIDWKMEPLDGIETLKRIQGMLGVDTPPALLLTAFDQSDALKVARSVGCDTVLAKPVTASSLYNGLVDALARSETPVAAYAGDYSAEAAFRRRCAGRRVLIAEDNIVNQEVLKELLSSIDITVDVAGDGAQAIEMTSARHYDIVFMDMQMPVLDGLSATRAIRALQGEALRIVALTANAFGEDAAECMACGMDAFLTKPLDVNLLHACLLQWLPESATAP